MKTHARTCDWITRAKTQESNDHRLILRGWFSPRGEQIVFPSTLIGSALLIRSKFDKDGKNDESERRTKCR